MFFVVVVAIAAARVVADMSTDQTSVLRVGVLENPPLVFLGGNQQPAGFAIEVLEAIARHQGWQPRYITGNRAEQFARLEQSEIDLLVGVAHSEALAERFDLNRERLIDNWGVLYARRGLAIHSVLDLHQRRVALVSSDMHGQAFADLLRSFDVRYEPVYRPDYEAVLAAVQRGEADAGTVDRLFAISRARKYALDPTGIVFYPIAMHYAAPKNARPVLLRTLDRQLGALKRDTGSIYHQALSRWFAPPVTTLPRGFAWAGAAVVLLLLGFAIAGLWTLRRQLRRRTRELTEQSHALEHEVGERMRAQDRLNRLAYFDPVTSLPNRSAFIERFDAARHEADRYHAKIALLLLDVDRFKDVNDSLGHAAGDRLLQSVAKRLHACLRASDTLYRFGGDEFVITVGHVVDPGEVHAIARRLLASLTGPFAIDHHTVYTTASLGIALYPDHGVSADELLRNADTAMYAAKEHGRSESQLYEPTLTLRAVERFTTETRLRAALERHELALYYQPIIEFSRGRVIGVEALVRWQDPLRGLVMPTTFVPSAEESGMIVPIGQWVLEQACRDLCRWQAAGLGSLRLSVNISSRQFEHRELLATVRAALDQCNLPPERLELEITEGAFLALTDHVRATLAALTDLGIRLAIDDFGTGYSSLSFLKQLPFDDLKIDRSFVAGIPHHVDDMQIATTIINMARDLGITVIAEGVETHEQYRFLRARGCIHGQGNYFSTPLPAAALEQWLRHPLPHAVSAGDAG